MGRKLKYAVALSDEEVRVLQEHCRKGVHSARTIMRCRVLLAMHRGVPDKGICASERIGRTTPLDIRKRYCAGGVERAICDAPRCGQPPRLAQEESVQVVAIACSDPPAGRDRWTIRLITAAFEKQTGKKVSRSTINRVLLNNSVKPWREKNVVRAEAR